jgi:hypothetical protein
MNMQGGDRPIFVMDRRLPGPRFALPGCASATRARNRRLTTDFARRALQVAGDDPGILANAGVALACFGEHIGDMMALVPTVTLASTRALRGLVSNISGTLRLWAGHSDIAIEHAEASLRTITFVVISQAS